MSIPEKPTCDSMDLPVYYVPVDTDGYFDQTVAEHYDDPSNEMFAPHVVDATVDFLLEHSRGGDLLEFGIGTGRIALPLSGRDVKVAGIDISQAMLDQLAKKAGGDEIEVTRGDFATTRVPGSFSVVYLVFNTIMNLTSQAEQVACFRNAAAHLGQRGRFVVEVMIPDLRRLPPGQTSLVFRSDESGWGIDESYPHCHGRQFVSRSCCSCPFLAPTRSA